MARAWLAIQEHEDFWPAVHSLQPCLGQLLVPSSSVFHLDPPAPLGVARAMLHFASHSSHDYAQHHPHDIGPLNWQSNQAMAMAPTRRIQLPLQLVTMLSILILNTDALQKLPRVPVEMMC